MVDHKVHSIVRQARSGTPKCVNVDAKLKIALLDMNNLTNKNVILVLKYIIITYYNINIYIYYH